jgi:hypothetical protein
MNHEASSSSQVSIVARDALAAATIWPGALELCDVVKETQGEASGNMWRHVARRIIPAGQNVTDCMNEGAWLCEPMQCLADDGDKLDTEKQVLALFRKNMQYFEEASERLQRALVDGRRVYDAYAADLAKRLEQDPLANSRAAHVEALIAIGDAYVSRHGWSHRGHGMAVSCERAETYAFRALSSLGAEYTVIWGMHKVVEFAIDDATAAFVATREDMIAREPRADGISYWLPLLEAAAVYPLASPLVSYVVRALRLLDRQAHRIPITLEDMHAFVDRCQQDRRFELRNSKYASRFQTATGAKRKRPQPITRLERNSDFVQIFCVIHDKIQLF